MFKKARTTALALLASFVLAVAPATVANAYTPSFLGHKYVGGSVADVTVWINYNSGVGYWETYINGGINNWMYTGWANDIYMRKVSSNYGSKMDFHQNSDAYFGAGQGVLAQTEFFSSSGSISPWNSDWTYAEVHINNDMYRRPSFTNEQAQGTTIHEMGHAFGLAHSNDNPYSIMCQTGSGRIVQRVQKVDNDTINLLY